MVWTSHLSSSMTFRMSGFRLLWWKTNACNDENHDDDDDNDDDNMDDGEDDENLNNKTIINMEALRAEKQNNSYEKIKNIFL